MAQYKHFLIASDLTPDSVYVCQKAKELADLLKVKLSIIHVVAPSPLLYGGGEFVIPMNIDIENALAEDAKKSLREQAECIGIPREEQWVVIGNMRQEMHDMVEKHGVDLMIVGVHDRHGLANLLPNTTDTLVHAMPCDIWIIKTNR